MKSYKDLEIFNEAKRLAIVIHQLSMELPSFELYEEGQQIRRSSKAVASMIVEGYSRRRYKADFIKHLIYAQAECDETLLHLDFLVETSSLDESKTIELRKEYDLLSKRINTFIKWVKENHK